MTHNGDNNTLDANVRKNTVIFLASQTKHAWLLLIMEGEHLRNNQLTWEQDWQRRKRRKEGCRKDRNGKEEKPQHSKQEGKEKQNFRIH